MHQNHKELVSETFGQNENTPSSPKKLIQFYEKIRKFPKFERENVPIVETVFKDGEIYFLQYLRGRNFAPANFVLSRSIEPGEVEVEWVRGTTPSSGIICDTRFWYEDAGLADEITKEDASFDFHWNRIFSELMTPDRKVQLNVAMDFNHLMLKSIDMHLQKSKLFRSDTSLFLSHEQMGVLFPEFEHFEKQDTKETLRKMGVEHHHDFRAKLYLLSDGYRAIIKRIS